MFSEQLTRRRLLQAAFALGPAAYLAACNRPTASPPQSPTRSGVLNPTPGQLTGVPAASDLAVIPVVTTAIATELRQSREFHQSEFAARSGHALS